MKHFLLINVSPRAKGTSVMLSHALEDALVKRGHRVSLVHLYPNLGRLDEIILAAQQADIIVFSGPCYVNTYPADTYALLAAMAENRCWMHDQKIYGIIQGGMPYAHTHESGLAALRLFAKTCGLSYQGGFVMGMGAMLNGQPLEKLPFAKKVIRQWNRFSNHVEKGEASPDAVYQAAQPRLPGFVCRVMAGYMNRLNAKELKAHGIDMFSPSPYLERQE